MTQTFASTFPQRGEPKTSRSPKDQRTEGEAFWTHSKSVRRDHSEGFYKEIEVFRGHCQAKWGEPEWEQKASKPREMDLFDQLW